MAIEDKIKSVQKRLIEENIEGWLIYDFHGINPFAREFLGFDEKAHLTRRYFYWIPSRGIPIKLVHAIESHVLNHLPGEKRTYFTWQSMEKELFSILDGIAKVAMEYSPRNAVPYVSKVDAGIVDLVREKTDVVSSSSFLQYYSCVLDDEQIASHLFAAKVLEDTIDGAWKYIASSLTKGEEICEYDVQQWILAEIHRRGCITDGEPNCSVGPHSANPHYAVPVKNSTPIRKGDFILIDLWCKRNTPRAVFADITRVGIAALEPSKKQKEVFEIVKKARNSVTDFIKNRIEKKVPVRGYEADAVAREVIEKAGYGAYFIHRTGHNIHIELHGPGAHLDSLETKDDRLLIPGTCCSVEPGIYLPNEFGVRLEYDILLPKEGGLQVTGGIQEQITALF